MVVIRAERGKVWVAVYTHRRGLIRRPPRQPELPITAWINEPP
ncbi:hypothetical protein AB0H00_19970 [Nocardia sp. NPDC023852]